MADEDNKQSNHLTLRRHVDYSMAPSVRLVAWYFPDSSHLVSASTAIPVERACKTEARTRSYYNKEYREGFPRGFLHTAAVENPRTRRVKGFPTAKVCKNSRGTIPTVFLYFIYLSRPFMMLKYVKTCQNNPNELPTNSPLSRFQGSGARHPDYSYYFCNASCSFNIQFSTKQMTSRSLLIFLCVQNQYPPCLRFLRLDLRLKVFSPHPTSDYKRMFMSL